MEITEGGKERRKKEKKQTIHADRFEWIDIGNIGKVDGLWGCLWFIQKRVILGRR